MYLDFYSIEARLKRLISILIITLTVFHLCGFCLVFVIAQKSHRAYIRSKIKSELVKPETLRFSKNDIKSGKIHIRYVKDDEIKIHNSMYDIISVKETSDSIIFTCINDKEEEKLIEKYMEKENNSDSKSKQSIFKNLKPFSVFIVTEMKNNFVLYSVSEPESKTGTNFYKSIITDVLSPPPETI
ncbi:MAG: hypothetical protein A2X61_07110 [Ignavibacteria bacterium GWB2_35_12]|nr:MAG: hypothetical protein A2X61_07110 [Ignavibacteria bacterium GWB2_35_12]OGU88681.1 MAG: hypothetical protein A2220_00500 [Ignavibacteria bacterium RIFOXYA2_FULL_35_10]